jgi:hypothetical protein
VFCSRRVAPALGTETDTGEGAPSAGDLAEGLPLGTKPPMADTSECPMRSASLTAVSCLALLVSSLASAEVTSDVDIHLYGVMKGDVAWENARLDDVTFPRWVQDRPVDRELGIYANDSRFGVELSGPGSTAVATEAKLELDFHGASSSPMGAALVGPAPQLREGWAKVTWLESDVSLLGGQAWDLVGGGNPRTLAYGGLYAAGNIGSRRPQLQLRKGWALGGATHIDFLLAATQMNSIGPQGSGYPVGQARSELLFPIQGKTARLGVSGHYGVTTSWPDGAPPSSEYGLKTWSGALDALVPLTPCFSLDVEVWAGQELSALQGAIGQGARDTTQPDRGLRAVGGYASLRWDPKRLTWLSAAVGAGLDKPLGSQRLHQVAMVAESGPVWFSGRTRNLAAFANVGFELAEPVNLGFEAMMLETTWHGQPGQNNELRRSWRGQTSLQYRF